MCARERKREYQGVIRAVEKVCKREKWRDIERDNKVVFRELARFLQTVIQEERETE